MQAGIFAKTYARPTLAGVLDAVVADGLRVVQFNLACAGLDPLPAEIPAAMVAGICDACAARGVTIAALSGTFNAIHPDPVVRAEQLARFGRLVAAAPALGTRLVTICTGTRDPENMWRAHPANTRPDAWADLLASMETMLTAAAEHGVTLAFEPEPANVVCDAAAGERLLRAFPGAPLGVVLDAANLLDGATRPQAEVVAAALARLGARTVLAHAKDLGEDGHPCAAGRGVVDWPAFVGGLRAVGYDGPLVLHGLAEAEVPPAVATVTAAIAATSPTAG